MKFFLLFFLEFVTSVRGPVTDVAAAARANDIVPTVIPTIDLRTHLFVNYTQPAGSYTNCDQTFERTATMFSLNDTGITYTYPWDARSYRPGRGNISDYFQYRPEIVWEPTNDTIALYTLMMLDPLFILDRNNSLGPYLNHYMVINIQGNNISSGEEINQFVGPAASDPSYHKYTFVLYAQAGMIFLSDDEKNGIQQRKNFNVTTFLSNHSLGDAVGINWMFTNGDSWGPVEAAALGFGKLDCFVPVEDAARDRGIVPSVLPSLNLNTHLGVVYDQPAGNYTNCDQLFLKNASKFRLNDTATTYASPWDARSYRPAYNNLSDYTNYQPAVTWNATNATTQYTLLMVDAGHSENLTFSDPLVEHWMVVNIMGNDITTGEVINPLLGPAPIDQFVHTYTFILYQQTEYLTLTPDQKAAIQARRNFNLTAFTQDHNLNPPVGVNWLYASSDSWAPVVQNALNFSKLDCFGPIEQAARYNDIVPKVVPMLNLTSKLGVEYSQPAGSYTKCGQVFNNDKATFSLNDTGITTQTPWNTRSYRPNNGSASDFYGYTPAITWTAQTATLYTVLAVDPVFVLNLSDSSGPYIEHFMAINVVGNNITSGNIVNAYLGPAPLDTNYHKYVFVVYPQTATITLTTDERRILNNRFNFNLTNFLSVHNFTSGAIAINWVYATYDDFSAVEQNALNFTVLDCFGPVENAAQANGIVPDIIPSLNLTTHLSVQFVQPKASYTSCGKQVSNDAFTFNLSDISVTNATPWNMRSYRQNNGTITDYNMYAPDVRWVSNTDALYTLMMVDRVTNTNSTWGPYVQHWMVINIPGNNTSNGKIINPYLGPAPFENNAVHKYTFVLYEQNGVVTLTADEITAIQYRRNFNLTDFIGKHNFGAANGVNWGFASVDPFALEELNALGWLELDCLGQVADTASALGIVPAILPMLNLDTLLQVTFTQPAEPYINCDASTTPNAFNQSLIDTDVLNVYQQPWDLRSYRSNIANKSDAIVGYAPAISWQNPTGLNLYTLLVVDPIYLLNREDPNGPFLNHYMVVNINDANISSGLTINRYFGPAPLDSLYHKYLFLLYRQQSSLNITGAQIADYQTRKNFNLTAFVNNNNLAAPVGINWVFAQADSWSPVAQDYIGFKPLKCPPAPTPAAGDPGYVHLSTGAFAAIMVIGGLLILGLLAYICYHRSQDKRKVGTGYNALPGEGGVRKTSVNRRE